MFRITRALPVLLLALGLFLTQSFSADVTGKINFKGAAPAKAMIKMNADAKCMKIHGGKDVPSDAVVVNPNNTLQWVFIHVVKGLEGKKFPTPTDKVTLHQQGCMYSPHVFGIMANQTLEIVNDDPFLHNVHAMPKNSTQFNMPQIKQGMKNDKTFEKPEIMVKLKCDVHGWMSSYCGVTDNPYYAVSDDKGNFTIKGLPAGEYDLEAVHEKYGTQTIHVKVGASNVANADFSFSAK
jgi:hypothetical protein